VFTLVAIATIILGPDHTQC